MFIRRSVSAIDIFWVLPMINFKYSYILCRFSFNESQIFEFNDFYCSVILIYVAEEKVFLKRNYFRIPTKGEHVANLRLVCNFE